MSTKVEYYIPSPPSNIFASTGSPEEGIIRENSTHFIIDRITYENGIQVYYKDCPFPRKGFPTPEAVNAINIVKRTLIEAIKTITMWQFFASWVLILITRTSTSKTAYDGSRDTTSEVIPVPSIEKILSSFNRIAFGTISKHILKPEYMTPLASEFQALLFVFIRRMGIDYEIAKKFSIIFGTILEYDNAYRYRLEDIFTETSKEELSHNPRREIKRLLSIYLKREKDTGVAYKHKMIFQLMSLPLLLPMVKSSLRKALTNCEFNRLQFDEADRYWCRNRFDYDFFSQSIEKRMEGLEPLHGLQVVM